MVRHFSNQFEEDLKRLKEMLLLMGGTVESMLTEAQEALVNDDKDLARKIIRRDTEVDALEKRVDQAAIEILAIRQPTATDLRFVTSAFKICTDLERMGDIVVNVCERITELSSIQTSDQLLRMIELTKGMIALSLDAFVNQSVEIAAEVLDSDRDVDQLLRKVYDELIISMKKDPETIQIGIKLFFIAKYLERIADHATNIAEQVIFTVKGLDIRHSHAPGPTPTTR